MVRQWKTLITCCGLALGVATNATGQHNSEAAPNPFQNSGMRALFQPLRRPVTPALLPDNSPDPSNSALADPVACPTPVAEPNRHAFKPVTAISVDLTLPDGKRPEQLTSHEPFAANGLLHAVTDYTNPALRFSYCNPALGFTHQPLYTEDVALERYGASVGCLDPVLSGAHFFGTLPILPYKMAIKRPHERVATYGRRENFWQTDFSHRGQAKNGMAIAAEAVVMSAIILGL